MWIPDEWDVLMLSIIAGLVVLLVRAVYADLRETFASDAREPDDGEEDE